MEQSCTVIVNFRPMAMIVDLLGVAVRAFHLRGFPQNDLPEITVNKILDNNRKVYNYITTHNNDYYDSAITNLY